MPAKAVHKRDRAGFYLPLDLVAGGSVLINKKVHVRVFPIVASDHTFDFDLRVQIKQRACVVVEPKFQELHTRHQHRRRFY